MVSSLSDKEIRDFASSFERAMNAKDSAGLHALFDAEAIVDTATADLDLPSGFREGIIRGTSSVSENITSIVSDGGSCKFLRVSKNDAKRILFRMILPDERVDYYEMVVGRDENGSLRVRDMHVFSSGEMLTQVLRRLYIVALVQQGQKVPPNDNIMQKLPEMMVAMKEGRPKDVLAMYGKLPRELQRERIFLITRIHAAREAAANKELLDALKDFRAAFPDDPCVDLLSYDYHLRKKDYKNLLGIVDRLEKVVGGDPYLNVLRADFLIETDDLAAARKNAMLAVEQEPTLKAYMSLVTISLRERNFDETVQHLETMARKFDVIVNGDSEEFAEFVKSPQYQKWRKSQSKN